MFPFALVFGAIGLAASLAGTAVQMNASQKVAKASQKAEKLREKQMELETMRQSRQNVRNMLRARSAALVSSTAQGGTGGSGIEGGLAQITGAAAGNELGIAQGATIGRGIFKANRQIADAQSLAAFGGGLSSMGQMISGIKIG